MMQVPRSGWSRISAAGTPSSSIAAGQMARASARFAGRNEFVEAGQRKDDRRLHEFRRLEADRADVEPALRALGDEPQRLDPEQHDQVTP